MNAISASSKGPFIGNKNYDLEMAISCRAEGIIGAVVFRRYFIANPDLVARLRTCAELTIASRESYYGGGAKGYIDWPFIAPAHALFHAWCAGLTRRVCHHLS